MDHFAVFAEPPRPWLDPERLKDKFLALSSEVHPDRQTEPAARIIAEQRFSELNRSYEILRHSRSRLLHFLELRGAPDPARVQNVPPAALEFFDAVAERTRQADALLKEKSGADSPMLKVRFFGQALEATTQIQELQSRLAGRIRAIDDELRSGGEPPVAQLQEWAAALGFLEKWSVQLQQRLAALAF